MALFVKPFQIFHLMSTKAITTPPSISTQPGSPPDCAYAIVQQLKGKKCSSCQKLLGDPSFYRCDAKDWLCEACVATGVSQIRFWEKMLPCHWLATYYPTPVVYQKVLFRNIGVMFQACKFNTPQRFIEFARETSAQKAFDKANKLKKEVRSDWNQIKVQVMTFCQYLKFSQNKELGEWLIATKSARLVECSDDYWGEGSGGKGSNRLGRILQDVRKLIKDHSPVPKDLVAVTLP
ncbi:hypothetical protein A4X13_0g3780 [Tilletia indica]|uniref:NADAR domain-containing protein n=1 Tax=Tilletia indica TaxID=43049 RepID=A0A8T8T0L6_9BASI|nr:hypothetical protein A4X13_0g3780 [Tilletia indica]